MSHELKRGTPVPAEIVAAHREALIGGRPGRRWLLPPAAAAKGPRDECGVMGVFGNAEATRLVFYGLVALQHRGQESAGIAAMDDGEVRAHRGMGLVFEVFDDDEMMAQLPGSAAVGHVRYSTTGSSNLNNAQPLVLQSSRRGPLALAHNGNLVDAAQVRARLEEQGSIFQTTTDTEVLAHLLMRSPASDLAEALTGALAQVKGGYALVMLSSEQMIGVRDPNGIRPLCLGRLGQAWVLASESCAIDTIGGEYVRDIEPGEMVTIDQSGVSSQQALPSRPHRLCVFEHIYFARPDTEMAGLNVHAVRKEMGRQLAHEAPAAADLVMGVPDSSLSAATGFAEASGIPYEVGLVKNRYVGRTFIQPTQEMRDRGVRLKLNPLRKVIEGKRVVLVDDSIVRGTTSRHLVRILKDAGAREVHMRISSPPYRHACHYGIDTAHIKDLAAASRSVEEIRELIGADSLAYLSIEGMLSAVSGQHTAGSCTACFNGDYPVAIPENAHKFALESPRRRGGALQREVSGR